MEEKGERDEEEMEEVSNRSMVKEEGGGGSEGSSQSSVQLAPPTWRGLVPLRTGHDSRRLLRAILDMFVVTVEVEKPGLLEELMAARVVCDRDAESLAASHLPTPTEKARRLWTILYEIDHKQFVRKVLPPLCKHYWYIIPPKFWLPGDASSSQWWSQQSGRGSSSPGEGQGCVRCAIRRRIRPTDLGDFLMTASLISSGTHRTISSSYRTSSTDWSKIFRAFRKLAGRDVRGHVTKMRKLMRKHSLAVPDNLAQLMVQGFPCCCSTRKQCVRSTSSSVSSLPSVASGAVSMDTDPCPSSPSLTSRSSCSDSDYPDRQRLDDFNETTLKQVVSIQAEDPCNWTEERRQRNHECGDEETELKEIRSDSYLEGKLLSGLIHDEEETRVKQFIQDIDISEMTTTSPELVVWREYGSSDLIRDEQPMVLENPREEKMELSIAGDTKNEDQKTWSVEIHVPEIGDQEPESHLEFSMSLHKDCNVAMEGENGLSQVKSVLTTMVHASHGGEQNSSKLEESKNESIETLLNLRSSSGLCARIGSSFSRLCGPCSRVGLCLSQYRGCVKAVRVSCGHFCVGLALLLLVALPFLLIFIGVDAANYELIIAGSILLSFQIAFCLWCNKQLKL